MSETTEEMKVDPARAQALISQLGAVKDRVTAAAGSRTVRNMRSSEAIPGITTNSASEGPSSSRIEAQACERHLSLAPGPDIARSLRRELRSGAQGEG
jgi:hypothetical protein